MLRSLLVTAFLLLAAAVPGHIGTAAAAGAATIPCRTPVLEGTLICYRASARSLAESRLSIPPVKPVSMVRNATHLRLSQVRLVLGIGAQAGHGVNLLYGFGSVCWNNEFTCRNRYLVVGEAVGPGMKVANHMTRDRIHSGSSGSTTYGPWKFQGSVSDRNLVITVYGSVSKPTIHQLGLRLTANHALTASSSSLTLSGSVNGTEQHVMSVPDTGAQWRWQGTGSVKPLGQVTATGSNHAVGFVASGTPTGTMTLTGANGTLSLTLTYPQTKGFAPLPAQATYVISGGTGQYAGASGSGTVLRKFGSCPAGSTSCPPVSAGPVTYQFVASNGA